MHYNYDAMTAACHKTITYYDYDPTTAACHKTVTYYDPMAVMIFGASHHWLQQWIDSFSFSTMNNKPQAAQYTPFDWFNSKQCFTANRVLCYQCF